MTLTVSNIAYERNYSYLFQQVQFKLRPGEMLLVRGANGCGKSTLLRILAGFLTPHEGVIHWNHQPIQHQLADYQQQLHFIGHQNSIKRSLTVEENLQLYYALQNSTFHSAELHHIAHTMGLASLLKKPANQLSAGQQRRLGLAKLLIKPTTLWILDEPTTALDTQGQAALMQILTTHLKQNGMILCSSHHEMILDHAYKTVSLGEIKCAS